MTFPTSTVSTDHLDSSADDPSLARADLLDAVQKLNSIIDDADGAGGVAVLDGSGYIKTAQLPVTTTVSGTQILAPTTGVVNIQNVLRLSPLVKNSILALTPTEGDLVLCGNIATGSTNVGGLAIYDGTNWRALPFTANVFVTLS